MFILTTINEVPRCKVLSPPNLNRVWISPCLSDKDNLQIMFFQLFIRKIFSYTYKLKAECNQHLNILGLGLIILIFCYICFMFVYVWFLFWNKMKISCGCVEQFSIHLIRVRTFFSINITITIPSLRLGKWMIS